jgi:cGMP-dependent protein kinase
LLSSERQKVAEALEEVNFSDGHLIVKQGEPGDAFYIIKKGVVHVTKRDDKDGKEKQVAICRNGEFFGERALVNSEPRAATVTAKGAVECLTLNKLAFDLLLGPLKEILQRVKWDDKAAEAEAVAAQELKDKEEKAATTTTAAVTPASTKITREELQLVGLLGRGSFGLVQLMKHKTTKQTFALKQVCKSQVVQLGQQEHVISEKNVMAQMNHPFIVKLYATYKDHDFLYFLLDVCLGGELFTLLRQRRCFDEETAKFYAASVVLAFEYMHERDVIYRDLKVTSF